MTLENEFIRQAQDEVRAAKANLSIILYQEILNCAHAQVGETDGVPTHRICLQCGLAEEGWGPGYTTLQNKRVYKITETELYDLRTVHIRDQHKGPILRNETTRAKIIAELLGFKE